MKGHCDYHTSTAVEAERYVQYGREYIVLRCDECGRVRGTRRGEKVAMWKVECRDMSNGIGGLYFTVKAATAIAANQAAEEHARQHGGCFRVNNVRRIAEEVTS